MKLDDQVQEAFVLEWDLNTGEPVMGMSAPNSNTLFEHEFYYNNG
jgi:hypothetical protein